MFEFDEDLAADRYMEDYPWIPYEEALRMVRRENHPLHEKLHPAFLAWVNGETPEFEYEGFTLDGLKELIGTKSYFHAMIQMNIILKDPEKQIPRHRERRHFARM